MWVRGWLAHRHNPRQRRRSEDKRKQQLLVLLHAVVGYTSPDGARPDGSRHRRNRGHPQGTRSSYNHGSGASSSASLSDA